jgi:hypothetical protein
VRLYLVCIAANARNTLHTEIEGLSREAGFLEERHDERAETAVHMQTDVTPLGELTKCRDVVLTSIGEVHR